MISDLLGDLVAELVAGFLLGGPLRRTGRRPIEGVWDASLGSVSLALAAVSAAFAVGTLRAEWSNQEGPADPFLCVGAVALALLAARLGGRALRVTRRRRALAIAGLWCPAIAVSSGALVGTDETS